MATLASLVTAGSTATKDKVAYRLYTSTYSNTSSTTQAMIDASAASALTEVQQLAQWFEMLGPTAVTDTFEPWLVEEIIYKLSDNAQPDRDRIYRQKVDRSKLTAISALARTAVNSAITGSSEAFVYHYQNTRYHVLNHCLKRSPALLPAMEAIDAATDACLKMLWNRAGWRFRKRACRMRITRRAITNGTWTPTGPTNTLTSASITTAIAAGSMAIVTGGTGATTGDYIVQTAGTGSCVLESSLSSSALATGDIAVTFVTVTFEGLGNADTFDSIASAQWYYEDSGYEGTPLCWVTGDAFAFLRTADATIGEARPRSFRVQALGSTPVWGFSPVPNTTYALRGEVLVRQVAAPGSVTETTAFDRFAPEAMPLLRRMVLDRVLTDHGRHDETLHQEVNDEMESMFPVHQNVAGDAGSDQTVRDATGDYGVMANENNILGGAM